MDIKVVTPETNPNVKVLQLTGLFDATVETTAFGTFMEVLGQSAAGVIVDLAKVDFMSSAGLRVVLAARKKAETDGKRMALVGAQPSIYKIFKISGLDMLLHFFEDENEALQVLWPQT